MDKRPTAGIILAAGMSTRFGMLKQLIEIGDSTILAIVVDAALRSDLDQVTLVLGYRADAIVDSLGDRFPEKRFSIIINHRYREGMSTSLKCGLNAVKDDYPSIMVLMGDQPLVGHDVINLVLGAFRGSEKDICVPVCRGRKGLPACFSRGFYDDILAVNGDMGAREIIRNNPTDVLFKEMEDSSPFMDVDREEDLERIKSLIKKE